MHRLRKAWRFMGPFADVSGMRRDTLLRQLAESAREQTRTLERASGHRLSPAWRTLALLLSGRRLCRILSDGVLLSELGRACHKGLCTGSLAWRPGFFSGAALAGGRPSHGLGCPGHALALPQPSSHGRPGVAPAAGITIVNAIPCIFGSTEMRTPESLPSLQLSAKLLSAWSIGQASLPRGVKR